MKKIGIAEQAFLAQRMRGFAQVSTTATLDTLPPYLDTFLAHLRLLVGVPFHYLVADPRLLPEGSIRFFYLDRSWTDRLVDGALAVGAIGTRELAHTQTHAAGVQQNADDSETLVRDLQRKRITDYVQVKRDAQRPRAEAGTITGLLLRSALVSGWPHLELRALRADQQLTTLRLERLSPGVLIALFDGVPDRVELEEPHHGVQFGIDGGPGAYRVFLRRGNGEQVRVNDAPVNVSVPMRAGGRNVVHISALRKKLQQSRATHSQAISQSGSGAMAISLLNPPYQQPFEGAGQTPPGTPSTQTLAKRVMDPNLKRSLQLFLGKLDG